MMVNDMFGNDLRQTDSFGTPRKESTMITETELNAAYVNLTSAMTQAHAAARAEVDAKRGLEKARLAAITDGRIDGKNAELREAAAREALADLYASLEEAERVASDARLALDLAKLEVERVRALLRITEVAAAEV